MICLGARLSGLDALSSVLTESASPAVLDRAVRAALKLPTLDGCADEEALLAAYPPPPAATRAPVNDLSERLIAARR